MKSLIPRSLTLLHLPRSSRPPFRLSLLFIHSSSTDRRSESHPPSPPSHSFTSSSSPSRRHQHEEESKAVKVSVWWDFENCSIPGGVNVHRVVSRITSVLRSAGIKGPVTVTAFGDVCQLSRSTQEALTATGVNLTHVPHSGKNSSDRFFMADLVYWVSQNPPPAHFFLISGDRDFANILHRLRLSNYNILLASKETPGVLLSAATFMWNWSALVRGESITPKHFNHPPDGFYGSWYGHHKGDLDDPFEDCEQPATSQPEESVELVNEIKPRPIPRTVVNGIRQILHLYPEGMLPSELRGELKKNNINVDKDFYGHKKFTNLLSSLPSILKFIPNPNPSGDIQPLVVGIHKRGAESVELTSKVANGTETSVMGKEHSSFNDVNQGLTGFSEEKDYTNSNVLNVSHPNLNGLDKGDTVTRKQGPSPPVPPATTMESSVTCAKTVVDSNSGESTPQGHEAVNATTEEPSAFKESDVDTVVSGDSAPRQRNQTEGGEGFLKRVWKVLTGRRGDHTNGKKDAIPDQASAKHHNSRKLKFEDKLEAAEELKNVSSYPAGSASSSLGTNKSAQKDNVHGQSEKHSDESVHRVGFFGKVSSWWKPWKTSATAQDDNSELAEKVISNQEPNVHGEGVKALDHMHCHPEAHDLFSKPHFWDALESFLLTSKGSSLILKSRTREQLVFGLQKEGPWFLKDLKGSHLLHLVDLLVSEKKWVEEYYSQTFPFKLLLAKRCVRPRAPGTNDLSSLFRDRKPKSNLHRLQEQQNQEESPLPLGNSHNGVETACTTESSYGYGTKKKPPSREEILSDCHKLLEELLKENPEGFNMSSFRPAFVERYGYILDYQMLGYPKLVQLLQIMPGVRVESSYIVPSGMFKSDSKGVFSGTHNKSLGDGGGKVSSLDSESPYNGEDWEELGPVSDTLDDDRSTSKEMDRHNGFCEASLSDEVFSDSDDDTPPEIHGAGKTKAGELDSSLLQILDSWYSSKEGEGKDRAQAADGLVDCSKSSSRNPLQKLKSRSHKRYSFVSKSGDDEKEKLVDSILGSLKKAGDTRLQS